MLSSSVAVMPRTPCGAAGLRLLVLAFCGHDLSAALQTPDRPNILFIAIDDLNDWVEPLSGHPQSLTPNLSVFADDSVNFTRNYCTSPGCNPSRSTLMTGYHTYTSGMYSNYQDWRKVPRLAQATTLGEYFRDNGYYSAGAGKIYHYSQVAPRTWDDYFPSQTNNMPEEFIPENNPVNMPEFKYMYRMFDWDALSFDDTETADYKSVSYINTQLEMSHSKPFFLAAGIYRPHLPWYVPKKYFDLFPLDQIRLPEVFADDTTDLGGRATELIGRGGGYHAHVLKAGKWQEAIQGYLASIAFADAMVGQLLEALENSRYAKNTIVVIWSDHGWQLGEKGHWRKFALWENLIRTVLMVKVPAGVESMPEGSARGKVVTDLTSLLDIYPTLVDLAGLPLRPDLEGTSLKPLLGYGKRSLDRSIITTYDFADYSVRYRNWHYINYVDGSEELYDLNRDPNEWHNLAGLTEFAATKNHLKGMLPDEVAALPESSLIDLKEHHVPPVKSREYYFSRERRDWLKRFDQVE
ncbi:MAG: sulfatase [Fuerstiella sp.]|nr:sulfatase [Fuerstiella sp.]